MESQRYWVVSSDKNTVSPETLFSKKRYNTPKYPYRQKRYSTSIVDITQSINAIPPARPPTRPTTPPSQYTAANYLFAQSVDPDNEALKIEVSLAAERLRKGEHTVPSTIAKELATNPFMRPHDPAIQARTGLGRQASNSVHLGRIRQMKNAF